MLLSSSGNTLSSVKDRCPLQRNILFLFPFSLFSLPSREKQVLCLNGSDCLLWEGLGGQKIKGGRWRGAHKEVLPLLKAWERLPALLAAPAELCESVSPGTHMLPLQLWAWNRAKMAILVKPPANWWARGPQLSSRQCLASISQLWDEYWPVWIFPSPPSKTLLHKVKLKIPNTRHWNDWLDGPKQIFEYSQKPYKLNIRNCLLRITKLHYFTAQAGLWMCQFAELCAEQRQQSLGWADWRPKHICYGAGGEILC